MTDGMVNINSLLRQVRLDRGVKQKQARKDIMSEVSYSKMEHGKKSVNMEEMIKILNNLQVTMEEFVIMYLQPSLAESARVKLQRLYSQLPSEESWKVIVTMYQSFENRFEELSADELGVYFDIKALFHREHPEQIPPVTHIEQQQVIKRIMERSKHRLFLEDYRLVAQTILDMNFEDMKEVIHCVFPIDKNVYLTDRSKQHISNILLNSITPSLKAKQYEWAKELLDIAHEHKFIYEGLYYYLMQLTYLDNVYLFLAEKDMKALSNVFAILDAIKLIGEEHTAELLKKELNDLMKNRPYEGYSTQDIDVGKK